MPPPKTRGRGAGHAQRRRGRAHDDAPDGARVSRASVSSRDPARGATRCVRGVRPPGGRRRRVVSHTYFRGGCWVKMARALRPTIQLPVFVIHCCYGGWEGPDLQPPRARAPTPPSDQLSSKSGSPATGKVLHHGHDERDHQQTDDDVGENLALLVSLLLGLVRLRLAPLVLDGGTRVCLALQRRDDAIDGGGERLTVLLVLEVDGMFLLRMESRTSLPTP